MKRCILLFLGLASAVHAQSLAGNAAAPVSPITPASYRGFTNAITMQNEFLRAVIVPQIGRLMELQLLDSESPLRADPMLDKGKSYDTNTWANYGGSWVWLAEQNKWGGAFGRGWPPPVFDSPAADWTASAWKQSDGASFCRLQMDVGAPMHVRVTREFLLPKKSAKLQITQRIDRILESKLPVTIWNVAQVGHADEAVLPLDAGTELVALYDKHIPPQYITACSNAVVIDPRDIDENKVGTKSTRSWIAGRKGNLVLILIAKPGETTGHFPDGGCRTEMYTNKGLGYTEIESLSEERALAPGEAVANTVTLALYRSPMSVTGCALATWVRQLIGEIPFPPDVNETASTRSKLP
jgi:hypothetical protein